jgi:ABC-2 type transport system permease protein
MSARRSLATAGRVIRQLRHDPRTIALLLVVPCALLALLWWVLVDHPEDFDQYGPSLLAIFPLIVMFLVTSIATLRERASGTLERLLTTPLAKVDFLLGYAVAFGAAAVIQALLASGLSLGLLGMDVNGPAWAVVLVAVLVAVLGTSLGLFVSAFAQTEFQAVQFMPAVILPQLLLCGLIVPVDSLPTVLRWVAQVLPLTYSVEAMQHLQIQGTLDAPFPKDLVVVVGFTVGLLFLGAATLRRRTP